MGSAANVLAGAYGRGTLIERISDLRTTSLPFVAPKRVLQVTEASLVLDVLQVLQGYPTNNLPWDLSTQRFYVRNGIHVMHLSLSSLYNILQVFICAATSLRKVELFIQRVMKDVTKSWLRPSTQAHPTLEAFVNVLNIRLEALRSVALVKEVEAASGKAGMRVTLLSLFANLSRVFAGAQFLEHLVDVAIPEPEWLFKEKVNAAELATHILSSLYKELDGFCLLQDSEDDAYRTLLSLFVGCLYPMISSLNSWLHEGILSDPAGELFFYADKSVPIENSAFWERAYQMRGMDSVSQQDSKLQLVFQSPRSYRETSKVGDIVNKVGSSVRLSADSSASSVGSVHNDLVCPSFLQPIAKAMLSAGKSLQLIQYERKKHVGADQNDSQVDNISLKVPSPFLLGILPAAMQGPGRKASSESEAISRTDSSSSEVSQGPDNLGEEQLSLYEEFCSSLKTLLGDSVASLSMEGTINSRTVESSYLSLCSQTGFVTTEELSDMLFGSHRLEMDSSLEYKDKDDFHRRNCKTAKGISKDNVSVGNQVLQAVGDLSDAKLLSEGNESYEEKGSNLVLNRTGRELFVDESQALVRKGHESWLNLAQYCKLPALDDEELRRAVFHPSSVGEAQILGQDRVALGSYAKMNQFCKDNESDILCRKMQVVSGPLFSSVTDFHYGTGCGKHLLQHEQRTLTAIEKLLPYPTMLPSFKEHTSISEQLPFQSSHQKPVSILDWIKSATLKATPSFVLVQECLTSSIQKQVDHVGRQLLAKLMGEWQLMEELALLRAIYLVGSGDLLQQFASVLFNKLDRGEPWDDFYELNTMLQESVRSSSHGMALPALDSLLVTVLPRKAGSADRGFSSISSPPQLAGRVPTFGIDSLDSLFFTYRVAWPLELIIDSNAIKNYNQVMLFLFKVKRAKHALDKACRWTWKNGVGDAAVHKQRLLLQQKLMHFVNTLHQYVMDRVLYSAWVELSESMSSAGSLDEVISCHNSYLVSIQRQCLVAPDKLWTLIASRVKTILGLALNYYSIQRVLCDGVGAPALSARCQLEIERVERQFDECIVFLMRVLSFKLNVGHFPHLADLVTRINYNYYYMTEDGHLSTPIPESHSQTPRRASRKI